MRITLNGQPRTLEDGASVGVLLKALDLPPIRVAVEINEDLVPRRSFDQTPIRDGDRIEVVTLVGGG